MIEFNQNASQFNIRGINTLYLQLQSLELKFEKVESILLKRFFHHVKQPKT